MFEPIFFSRKCLESAYLALLRTVRAVRVEELPALGRHLGAGFTPVQGLRGLPGTAREVHQPQAVQRIAAGRGHRLRTISA